MSAQAGKYEVRVGSIHRPNENGQPLTYVLGQVVELSAEDAEHYLKHGAVKAVRQPPKRAEKKSESSSDENE